MTLPRKWNRKQLLLKLGVFLLLGAIVNVAVAWGCGLLAPDSALKAQKRYRIVQARDTRIYIDFGRMVISRMGPGVNVNHVDFPPTMSESEFTTWLPCGSDFRGPDPAADFSVFAYRETLLGWPVYALHGSVWSNLSSASNHIRGLFHFPHQDQSPQNAWNKVSYIPLWPGFAINTIFYAGILALLCYGPGKVRRMVRVRRFQCPACGHIIASGTCANGLCSECGMALPWMKKPTP
jgi:hypothetical protein